MRIFQETRAHTHAHTHAPKWRVHNQSNTWYTQNNTFYHESTGPNTRCAIRAQTRAHHTQQTNRRT